MHSRSPWRCNQTEVNKRGQGEVIGAPRAFKVGVRQLRAAQAITVAFLLQSPDRKKALTAQRTFDSEGESNHPGCVIAPFDFRSQTCFLFFFLSLLPFSASVCCRGGAVPELPGEGPAQRLGRGVQGTQTRQGHRGAVQAHSHLLEPAQRGEAELSRLPHISPCITC